ncbi:MAG: hypothetical protein IT384_07065 [Deltaproteobacteria bacterium]|nr:hypothetical protein [Deltaproteobacteria bacterium]
MRITAGFLASVLVLATACAGEIGTGSTPDASVDTGPIDGGGGSADADAGSTSADAAPVSGDAAAPDADGGLAGGDAGPTGVDAAAPDADGGLAGGDADPTETDAGAPDADSGLSGGDAGPTGADAAAPNDAGGLPARFALNFPSNVTGADQAAPFVVLQYDDPHLNGLPFAGPSGRGVTYMWRVNLRAQTGYYVTLWWSQGDGGFTPSDQYVGGHPYPKVANNTGTTHRWEIAAPSGGDYFDTRAGPGTSKDVVYDVWRTQALRVVRNANASKTYTFYTDLPSIAPDDVLEWTSGTGGDVAETLPQSPKITIGDSPWYAGYQHERLSGLLGELIIEAAARSEAEILAQAQDLRNLTPAFAADIWYFKPGWRSVDDVTCEAGTGRSFHWADALHKAALASF